MFEFLPFMYKNRFSLCWPRVTTFLQALRGSKGSTLPVGIAGFCWGGLHAVKLSQGSGEAQTPSGRPLADAFFAAHPSNLSVPADLAGVRGNLSIAIGDDDGVMPMAQVRAAQKMLADRPDVDAEVVVYPGAKHGFAVRASRARPDSRETRQAEEAEGQAVEWFRRQFEAAGQKQGPMKP